MPIKDINFKTSVFTGTKRPESTGAGLARLVTASMQSLGHIAKVQRQMTEDEDVQVGDFERVRYNDKLLELDGLRTSEGYDSMTFQDKEVWNLGEKDSMSELFGEFKSSWAQKNKASAVMAYNKEIGSNFKKGTIQVTNAKYSSLVASYSMNPAFSFDDMGTDIADLNSLKGVTGTVYDKSVFIQDVAKRTADRIDATPIGDFNETELAETYPMFYGEEAIKDATALETVRDAVTRQKDGAITADTRLNKQYKGTVYDAVLRDSSDNNIALYRNRVIQNKKINGVTRKEIVSYLDSLTAKGVTANKKWLTAQKKGLTSAISLFMRSIDFGGENTQEQDGNSLSFMVGNSEQKINGLYNSIDSLYADEPQAVRDDMKDKIDTKYRQSINNTLEVVRHQSGQPILSNMRTASKRILTDDYTNQFMIGVMSSNEKDHEAANNALLSLNKVPEAYTRAFEDAIKSKDDIALGQLLTTTKSMMGNHKSRSILRKNPRLSAVLDAHNTLRSSEKIITMLYELEDPKKKEQFYKHKSDILYNLKLNDEFEDVSYALKSVVAEKLAYDTYFGLSNGKNIVEDAKDELNNMRQTEDNFHVLDANSVYQPKELEQIGKLFTEQLLMDDEVPLNAVVDGNGGVHFQSNGVTLLQTMNQKETNGVIQSLIMLEKANEKPRSGISKVGHGIAKSASTLWQKADLPTKVKEGASKVYNTEMFFVREIIDKVGRINENARKARRNK